MFQWSERIADWQWHRSQKDRLAVASNLSVIYGHPISEEDGRVREVFRNFARYLVEFCVIDDSRKPILAIEGQELLSASPQGTILLTAHIGNWELGALLMSRLGLPLSVVALPHPEPCINQFFLRQRARCGISVIPLNRQSAAICLQHLHQGKFLGLLGDREFSNHGVEVPFFGQPILLPRGPATLSLRSGTAIIPVFLIREGPWRFRLFCEPPIEPRAFMNLEREESVTILTQQCAKILEKFVRRFPEQWLLFQPMNQPPRLF
ncbi:MAG: lysophospholipid acyltransferase family protein [Candidatus Omnitrophica bacterium]|nr:lysophospholipid acyltransferase family protein [Candidatus Omnitrophota bacterium]